MGLDVRVTGYARWKMIVYDSSSTPIDYPDSSPSNVTASGTWTYMGASYTVPSNGAYVQLYCEVYEPTATTVARFDDAFISAGTQYYHQDHLSNRLITNSAGADIGEQGHFPYGELWYPPILATKWVFTGKERDSESGLDNFGARYDSSQYGRFMTPDSPSYSNRKNPQSWNLYACSLNNPVSFRDADGHDIVCANNEEQCKKDAAAATANAEAAKRVTTDTTTTQHSFLGLFHWTTTTTKIGISGDINSFRSLSTNAAKLADLVTNHNITVTVTYSPNVPAEGNTPGFDLYGGSSSRLQSQGFAANGAWVDPTRTPDAVYDPDAEDQGLPQSNTAEEFGHEVLGHIWGDLMGGAPAGTRGNMRDSIAGEDAVRALDPTRGQRGLESHHNYNEMPGQ